MFTRSALCLVLGVGLATRAAADSPEDVTLCISNVVPSPLPPCFAIDGEWSATGALVGAGSEIETCGQFNGQGVSVNIGLTLLDGLGDSLSLVNRTILDWANLAECSVPDPNPCGLSCDDLYNARRAQWQITGGTGPWANLQGEGQSLALINREYDGEGVCPGGTGAECASHLCDARRGLCFRRVFHGYFWGRTHRLKTP